MFWFFGRESHGILAPQPRIEPTPPTLEGEVLTIGLPGKFQGCTVLGYGGCSVHCGVSSSMPGVYTLDACSTPAPSMPTKGISRARLGRGTQPFPVEKHFPRDRVSRFLW